MVCVSILPDDSLVSFSMEVFLIKAITVYLALDLIGSFTKKRGKGNRASTLPPIFLVNKENWWTSKQGFSLDSRRVDTYGYEHGGGV